MKYMTMMVPAALWLISSCPTAAAQAAVEYGAGVSRAASTASPSRTLSKGISGALDGLNKAIAGAAGTESADTPKASPAPAGRSAHQTRGREQAKHATKASATETSAHAAATPSSPAPPPPVYEDPRQIQPGLAYDELIRRFGPPAVSITTGPGKTTVLYSSQGMNYQYRLEDGKVVEPQRKTSE